MKNSITKQMIYTARQSQLCIGSRMEKYGITAAEEPFFMAVRHHSGASQDELTSLVGVDKAATTRALCSLERKGYVIRCQDEKDRRQKRIFASEKALEIGAAVHGDLLQLNDEILRGIPEEEQRVLYLALKKMQENLKRIRSGE